MKIPGTMNISRRNFLKYTGTATAGLVFESLGFHKNTLAAPVHSLPIKYGKKITSICPYCAVGCGLIIHTRDNKITYVEGDPDHPINEGALCSKGAALIQISSQNPERLTTPLYRAPKSDHWQKVSWGWALDKIVEKIYYTRERTFIHKNSKGQIVNRTEGIASVGSAALNNEECYAYQKFLRALGLVYIEHQARLCYSSTLMALMHTFGLGAMTNHWIDLKNSDVILIMGSNAAENHPISFKWILKAKKKGATIIHVDPRFTRTSAKANLYAPIRAGTDLAFLGGMINFIIENQLYCQKFLKQSTNATFLVNPLIQLPHDLDGLFSGYDPQTRSYDKSTWAFQKDGKGVIKKDPTLQDEYCVFTLLRKHFYRYNQDIVSKITGTPKDLLETIYQTFTATKGPKHSGTIVSALGWTQHTVGTQNMRAMAIIQILLSNMGIAGGGINALRGESNAQGANDHSLLYEWLPGYLPLPKATHKSLQTYLNDTAIHIHNKSKYPQYMISLLKAFFGQNADKTNDYGFHWLPKIEEGHDYSWLMLFDAIYKGKISGAFVWAQNPACSGANATKVRKSLANLDWLVDVNIFDNETASFWRGPNMDPSEINTEVFLLPSAMSLEKEGSVTNSGRWLQWRNKVIDPPGQAKASGEIITELVKRIKKICTQKKGHYNEAIHNLSWDFSSLKNDGSLTLFDPHRVAREINGQFLKEVQIKGELFPKGGQVPKQEYLQKDGSTSCGNWLYCSSYPEKENLAGRRDRQDPTGIGLFSQWAWSWPNNCRVLFNQAIFDKNGNPCSKEKAVLFKQHDQWQGDVPNGGSNEDHSPFPMLPEGLAGIFVPGMADGPFPEHYEPLECPIEKNLLSSQRLNPTIKLLSTKGIKEGEDRFMTCDPKFPIVCTTYRLSEHWQTGVLTRRQPWLLELQPCVFIEMPRELADNKDIKNGDKCIIRSARGDLQAVALVTERLQPLLINNEKIYQVGLPWHFGWMTPPNGGDTANILTPSIGDANTMIPETKAFMVNIVKG